MKKIYFFAALAFGITVFASCTNGKNKGENKDGDSTEQNVTKSEESEKIGPMGSLTMAILTTCSSLSIRMPRQRRVMLF